MTKQELIESLRKQADALETQDGKFEVIEFFVWSKHGLDDLGDALIRYQDKTHSWGCCRSETCAHNSHDPYMEGGTAFVFCKEIRNDENGDRLFTTSSGVVFAYNTETSGYHFAPYYNFQFK